ncbi:MAG TPA: hypothetical protein P5121_29665, partial [Caldilineaceae bacterium]|nr:hypothetical protein [Caldilineaceae bacterium]
YRGTPTVGGDTTPFIQGVSERGQSVAMAMLIEYAVATYGRDRLPLLVKNLRHHASWETLLPAVYDVSPAAFESGWQEHSSTLQ